MKYRHYNLAELRNQVRINLRYKNKGISKQQESLFESKKWLEFEMHFLLFLIVKHGYRGTKSQLTRLIEATNREIKNKLKNAPKKIDQNFLDYLSIIEKIKIEIDS